MGRKLLPEPEISLSNEEWAYAAGFIDGEGCIGAHRINPRTPSYQLSISAVQKHREPLDWLQERLGGKVYPYVDDMYRWSVGARGRVKVILLGLYPYLVLKKRQAAIGINMTKLPSQAVGTSADRYYLALRQLKKRKTKG